MADSEGGSVRDIHLNDLVPKRRKDREIWAAVLFIGLIALFLCMLNPLPFGGETEVCYPQDIKEKQTSVYSRRSTRQGCLSTIALLLIGAVIGTIIDRLCLVNEERNHLATRYDNSWLKMLASCFSGIKWSFVNIAVCLFVAVLLATGTAAAVRPDSIAIGLGGSLIVLLVRLFNANTRSLVEVSRTLEDNERSVANGLAWSYYFGYLEIILPGLKDRVQTRGLKLSSEKLFILLPFDCNIRGKIEDVDRNITEANDDDVELVAQRGGLERKYNNKVHCIRFNGERYRVLLEYCSTLETLRKMSIPEKIRALGETEMIEQVKLFCQTLQVAILENPLNVECQGKCELVIYDSKTLKEQGMTLAGLLVNRIGQQQERGVEGMLRGVEELDDEEKEREFPGERGQRDTKGVSRVAQEHGELKDGEAQQPLYPTKETGKPGDTIQAIETITIANDSLADIGSNSSSERVL